MRPPPATWDDTVVDLRVQLCSRIGDLMLDIDEDELADIVLGIPNISVWAVVDEHNIGEIIADVWTCDSLEFDELAREIMEQYVEVNREQG